MTARLVRALALVLVMAAGGAGLAGCHGSEPVVAATVNGEQITAAELDQDLADIGQNRPFLEARREQGFGFEGTQPGTYEAGVVAELLDNKVTSLLVRQELARRGITPTAGDVGRAREALRRRLVDPNTGAPILDSFPERYIDQQARAQADSDALQASEAKVAVDEAALRQAYEASLERFRVWCVRVIVAGPDDPEAVTRAAAAIAAGEDFAQVAQRESADQDSASRGGALGCQTRAALDRLGDRFSEVVTSLAPGQVSPPTTADFGTFVAQVTDVRVRPFEEVRDVVRGQVLAPAEEAYEQLLQRLRREARVTIDPGYGTWEVGEDGEVGVQPPPGESRTAPGDAATQPLTRLPRGRVQL